MLFSSVPPLLWLFLPHGAATFCHFLSYKSGIATKVAAPSIQNSHKSGGKQMRIIHIAITDAFTLTYVYFLVVN